MFGIDEGRNAAFFLRFGNGMERHGGLTRRLGTIDFDDSSTRITAHTEGHIEADAAGRDHFHMLNLLVTHAHDGAFSKVFLYFRHCCLQCFQLFALRVAFVFFCHIFVF